ncbi:hypothetical protein, partial [Massilia timonae]|uniref:hypothetical protein n=1 Tax=Massilia timonae TaxID=47229 RepID=UPI0028B0DEB1
MAAVGHSGLTVMATVWLSYANTVAISYAESSHCQPMHAMHINEEFQMVRGQVKKVTPIKKPVARKAGSGVAKTSDKTRSYMSQEDIPAYELEEAVLVAKALLQQYAGHPSTPLDVAAAMDLTPSSGKFRMLCGASIAYGLTTGGYNAAQISVTDLARQIIEPQEEGADLAGRREAIMKPRILREVLSKYSGSQLPREDIAINVLKGMNVPSDRAKQVWDMILKSAESVGFLQTIKDRKYVNLGGVKPPIPAATETDEEATTESPEAQIKAMVRTVHEPEPAAVAQESRRSSVQSESRLRRVFITPGVRIVVASPDEVNTNR